MSLAGIATVLTLSVAPSAAAFGVDDVRRMPEETEAQRAAKASALHTLFERSGSR